MPLSETISQFQYVSLPSNAISLRRALAEVFRYVVLAAGLSVGFIVATNPAAKKLYIIFWLPLECLYLRAALRHGSLDKIFLRFLLKIQFQTAIKLFTHVCAILAVCMIFDYLQGSSMLPKNVPASMTVQDIILLRFRNFLLTVLSASTVIAIWRCYRFGRVGHNIAEIASGAYRRFDFIIPAAPHVVEAAMAMRFQQLQFDKAPRFTRMFFETRLQVRQAGSNRMSLALTWPLCPTGVELSIGRADSGTAVQMRFQLRGGLYAFEIFPDPREVTALLNFLKTNLVDKTDSEMRLAESLRKQDELRHLAVESQLRMLQTQIEPHFLFNTLANVQQMYRENLDEGESMLDNLTAYFRGAVEGFRSDQSTIVREIELSRRYLKIMEARMGGRLVSSLLSTEEVNDHPLPPAMLISLVENAIKHGIAPKMEGCINVTASRVGEVIRIEVADDGAGFSSVGGTGIGLSNLRQRLHALYGTCAWLEVEAGREGGFRACIVLPFESQE